MADIWQGIRNLITVPPQHLENWGDALIAKDPPWSNTPEYHQWATKDFVEEKANQLAGIPYVGDVAADVFKKTSPLVALGASPIYDTAQAFWKYGQNPEKYETNNKWDKINAYFPDLQGTTAAGILNAIDMENPLSAAYNRMIGAGNVAIESKINQQNQIQDLLKQGWDAIKNEFGGNVEAAEMPIQNRFANTVGPNPTETILPQKKPFQYDYDTADAFTADEMATQPIDELTEDSSGIWEALKMAGRVINPFKKSINPLGFRNPLSKLNFRNSNLYRGVTQPIGSYSPAQLNSMNALGGYYSEPAREQRRTINRVKNMMARKAAGKTYSKTNLANLSAQISGGRDPSQGNTVTGHGKSGMGRDPRDRMEYGGLATMFQRR
jgi:hypothetical protein